MPEINCGWCFPPRQSDLLRGDAMTVILCNRHQIVSDHLAARFDGILVKGDRPVGIWPTFTETNDPPDETTVPPLPVGSPLDDITAWLQKYHDIRAAETAQEAVLRELRAAAVIPADLETIAARVVDAVRPYLQPQPTATRIEYRVVWHSPAGQQYMQEGGYVTIARAHIAGPKLVGQYNIATYTVQQREHHTYPDSASWCGPWTDLDDDQAPPEASTSRRDADQNAG